MEQTIILLSEPKAKDNFAQAFLEALLVISASLETASSSAKATFTATIPSTYGSKLDARLVQPSAIAMFFEVATGLAMLAVKQSWPNGYGTSADLRVTCFGTVSVGERIIIETEILNFGERKAIITGSMKRARSKTLLAVCQHETMRSDELHCKL
jgi:acyl-coenzyme A thioesterase 13